MEHFAGTRLGRKTARNRPPRPPPDSRLHPKVWYAVLLGPGTPRLFWSKLVLGLALAGVQHRSGFVYKTNASIAVPGVDRFLGNPLIGSPGLGCRGWLRGNYREFCFLSFWGWGPTPQWLRLQHWLKNGSERKHKRDVARSVRGKKHNQWANWRR